MSAGGQNLLRSLGRELDGAAPGERRIRVAAADLAAASERVAAEGGRFLTLAVAGRPPGLLVAFQLRGEIVELTAPLPPQTGYPAVSARLEAASWSEREARDLHDLRPLGLPDARPLVSPDADRIARQVSGQDAFVIPYGPVRSGVFEAIQFVIETGGEDILRLAVRTGFKHRGLERRMVGLTPDEGVLVAERIAGISGVAHAIAYCQALERIADVEVSAAARCWRVVHAELERIANHLHSAAQLAETTALSVGAARFSMLKEEILRLRAELCGSRFGRGVVVPGGVSAESTSHGKLIAPAIDRFESDLRRDRRLLLGTASFIDRLVGTGRLGRREAEQFAVVGPVARGSGVSTDARYERPYAEYPRLGWELPVRVTGDAMARLEVRMVEIVQSVHLIRQALEALHLEVADPPVVPAFQTVSAWGWAEAAQGELLYRLTVAEGRLADVHVCSPDMRNWHAFAHCFPRDVLTDFGFVEHSFQLSPAGVDR